MGDILRSIPRYGSGAKQMRPGDGEQCGEDEPRYSLSFVSLFTLQIICDLCSFVVFDWGRPSTPNQMILNAKIAFQRPRLQDEILEYGSSST